MLAGKSGAPTSILHMSATSGGTRHSDHWKMERETIHSGHFMISNVPQDEDDRDVGVGDESGSAVVANQPDRNDSAVVASLQQNVAGFRVRSSSDPMLRGEAGGRLNIKTKEKVIDSSLSKLFECMTLAYRQKLTSPKWNNFKGLKLRWTIKIRLNNIIWRAWHMQFVKQVRPLIAPFAIEVDPAQHAKAEAVVMEGKYWKRRLSMVTTEYRRWRVWYKDRARGVVPQETPLSGVNIDVGRLERQTDSANPGNLHWIQQQIMEEPMITMDDLSFPPDFTDVLFSRLTNQPYSNSRELAMSGNADFIQPGLMHLQPSLEELMDTLEPLQDFFASQGYAPSSGYGSQYSNFGLGSDSGNNSFSSDIYSIQENDYWRNQNQVNQEMPMTQQSQLDKYSILQSQPPNLPRPSSKQLRFEQQQFQNSNNYQPNNPSDYINLQSMQYPQPSHYSQQQNDEDARKDAARPRSMSGPILGGQPLIEPGVLSQLANFGRSTSVSSGNLTPDQSMGMLDQNTPIRSKQPGNFAVPQATRGRKPKNFKPMEETPSQILKHSTAKMVQSQVPVHQLKSSTLAQLLTNPSAARNAGQRDLTGSQHVSPFANAVAAKKIAPKPSVGNVDAKTRISNSTLTSIPTVQPVPNLMANSNPPHFQDASPEPRASSGFNFGLEKSQKSELFEVRLPSGPLEPSFKMKTEDPSKSRCTESRRMNHITAEQKRRGHIKSGFEVLHGLVPSLAQNPSVKVSKAVVLHKGAEYIHQLKDERRSMQAEVEELKQQIEAINQAVIACQQQLPATGAPVNNRARNDRMNEMLEEYIRSRTMQNWKFWLFSHIMKPLFDGYTTHVSTRSMDEMSQSVMSWLDQQCTLVQLRPLIKEAMRKLSTTTHVLSDPNRLPEEARKAVQKNSPS